MCAAPWRSFSAARSGSATRPRDSRCAAGSWNSGRPPTPQSPARQWAYKEIPKIKKLQAPPPESNLLGGEADPAFLAAHRARERGASQTGAVVLLREVRGDYVLQPRAVERAQQALRLQIVKVPERSGDAVLEPLRVGAAPQHVGVAVAFQDQRIDPRERRPDMRGRGADSGHD